MFVVTYCWPLDLEVAGRYWECQNLNVDPYLGEE